MPPSQALAPQAASTDPAIPALGAEVSSIPQNEPLGSIDPVTGKRRLLNAANKTQDNHKEPEKSMEAPVAAGMMPSTQAAIAAMRPDSGLKRPLDLKPQPLPSQPIPISPSRHPYPSMMAASPSRIRSSSPRLHSPASSEIFERSVQEPVALSNLGSEISAEHIPTHVMTEDQIPPALEASAQAITSGEFGPDEVEIITSTMHQPAAASVLESSTSHADLAQLNSPPHLKRERSDHSEPSSSFHQQPGFLPTGPFTEDGASAYGQLDPNDVRRLSFISFADVVQGEHQQQATSSDFGDVGSRDSLHMSSFPAAAIHDRAASPLRSPRSPISTHSHSLSGGLTTPPLPGMALPTTGNAEQSPSRGVGSPVNPHGELQIQTMRQAVRKTASGDLGGARGGSGMSPVSDENSGRETRSRTNT